MTIYVDADYRCHTEPAPGRAPVETDAFDGKCPEWVAGMRYIPAGATWTRADGKTFAGEMAAPATSSRALEAAQAEATIAELDAAVVDLEYRNALLTLGVE